MSKHVSLSVEDDHFSLTLDEATIKIRELHIEPWSNLRFPFRVKGLGGAYLLMSSLEVTALISEYMRYNMFHESSQNYFCSETTDWSFRAERKRS